LFGGEVVAENYTDGKGWTCDML